MRKIQFEKVNDSGQVTILMLALVLALFSALPIVGSISQTLVNQQRLNAAADSSALAGALELEFNQLQACELAQDFKVDIPSSTMSCEATRSKIKLVLKSTVMFASTWLSFNGCFFRISIFASLIKVSLKPGTKLTY